LDHSADHRELLLANDCNEAPTQSDPNAGESTPTPILCKSCAGLVNNVAPIRRPSSSIARCSKVQRHDSRDRIMFMKWSFSCSLSAAKGAIHHLTGTKLNLHAGAQLRRLLQAAWENPRPTLVLCMLSYGQLYCCFNARQVSAAHTSAGPLDIADITMPTAGVLISDHA